MNCNRNLLMATSATLPPTHRQQTPNAAVSIILSSSLQPEVSPGDFDLLRLTRQSSEGIKKRSLGLHRGRPRIGSVSRGRTTDSLLERKASVQKLESSFARIRQQLAQSAEEYQALQDRLEKLNEEINKLRVWPHTTNFLTERKSWRVVPAVPIGVHQSGDVQLLASRSRGNLLSLHKPTWEGDEKRKLSYSCGESSESISDYFAGTPVSQVAFEFVIEFQQEHSPLSSGAEDDVFS